MVGRRCATCLERLTRSVVSGLWVHEDICQMRLLSSGYLAQWYSHYRWSLGTYSTEWCAEPFGEYAFYETVETPL